MEDTLRLDDSGIRLEPTGGDASVRVIAGANEGAVCPLTRSGLLLGRGAMAAAGDDEAMAELSLDDPWVSRRHARLHEIQGGWQLTDLGSRNRAFVDGAALAEGKSLPLLDGSLIRIGETLLVFRMRMAQREPAHLIDPAQHAYPAHPAHPAHPAQGVRPRGLYLSGGWPVARRVHGDAGFPGFPGCAPSARMVRRRMAQLARGSGHVLVLGETGTGKERVARAIGDPELPFVPQNCAELTRELARSELFGHLRGAFSGAVAVKAGLVEVAERGVLFLDEIGELTMDVQAELLRFLEDGCYRPVGGTELRRSGARVVAATNADLDAAVRAGRFRLDLLARLRASNPPLELPPLRDRREDILDWAVHFFREAVQEHAGAQPEGSGSGGGNGGERGRADRLDAWALRNAGTAECLLLYPWPGNLRELRGVMRGLAAAGLDLSLRPEQLPRELREHRRALRGIADATTPSTSLAPVAPDVPGGPGDAPSAASDAPAAMPGVVPVMPNAVPVMPGAVSVVPGVVPVMPNAVPVMPGAVSVVPMVAPIAAIQELAGELTREVIEAALTTTSGSIRAAARLLGIERRKLYRLCERLGIDLDSHRGKPKKEKPDA